MIYFQAKRDLGFIETFKSDVERFWQFEEMRRELERLTDRSVYVSAEEVRRRSELRRRMESYDAVRRTVAEKIIEATQIARRSEVTVDFWETPPPIFAGSAPVARFDLFQVILTRPNYARVGHQEITDGLNQTIGQCRRRVEREFWQLVNPFYWLVRLAILIIRLPFTIVKLSGFNMEKIEEHLWAKIFQLLYILALLFLGAWWGVKLF